MKFSRDHAAAWLVRTGLVRLAATIDSRLHHDLRVLAYHRVLPRTREADFGFDLELVSAWEEEFEWQVRHVARHHEVLTCRDLAALADAGRPLPRRALLITFDDGYRDNHDVALPILRRHAVPALVFVATGYMDRGGTFWYDQLVHDVLHSTARRVACAGSTVALGVEPASRRAGANELLTRLKRMPDEQRLADLAALRAQLHAPAPDTASTLDRPMTWQEVRQLSDAGIEIGSHGVSHAVLANIADARALRRELVDSKAAIDRHTGQPTLSLAYPVGGRRAYDERVVAAAREAGYRYAFAYHAGPNPMGRLDPMRIRRLAVERYVTRERFAAMLAMPALFAYGWSAS